QPPPTSPEEVHYHPQPEIQHTFRPQAKIPMKAISGIFALATIMPWFILLGLTPNLFTNQIFPFVALLAVFEALLVTYWIRLKLPQVLTYGAILSVITAAAGKRALSAIS
ncbi:6545_t:CDS:2, partial [Acaulospora colombiana]